MSLKSLIQRLLDSRTTPEEAGHSAMPTTTEITSQSFAGPFSSWGPVASGTASEDGYIYAAGAVATSGSNSEFRLDNGQFGSYIASTWGTQGLLLPVMKGQFWRLYAANRKDVVIRLYRLVGGGYNHFVRRALSCLRPSFNCLPRSFCKAKSLGLQNNQLLLSIRALIFLVQAPLISLPTPLRATAGRLLGAIQLQSQLLKSKSRTGRWHLLPYLTETLRELESVVTLKKGHRLSSCAVGEVQPIILFGSTKQVQTFNPLKGGALC
ncbi:hypothetical protein [Parasutterella sp.]|uniref:hypothetical protein n=1 Tax=Parasutterella sp. TaxID=2049037 RepID=UPI003AB6FBFE